MKKLLSVALLLAWAIPANAQITIDVASAVNGGGVLTVNGLATTSTDGLTIKNATDATAGATVQMSPRFMWSGAGWDTDATAVSRPVSFFAEVLPTSGATVAGSWKLGYIDPVTSAVTYPMEITNAGGLTTTLVNVGGGIAQGSGTALALGATKLINWTSGPLISSPADAQLVFRNFAAAAGFGFDFATDALLKVRTRAQTGYATVDALAYRTTAYSSGARVTSSDLLSVTEAVTLSGASTATAAIIPAGATVEGIATTTTTAIEGATGYTVGDGTDADRYGDITGTAVGTVSGSTTYTADPRWWTAAARAVTLTAKTSDFTAGVVQVTVFYRNATGT